MTSHRKDGKAGHKTKVFKCESGHPGCKPGNLTSFGPCDKKRNLKWEVQWVPCREEDAIAYMERKHGHRYRDPPSSDDEKSKHHKTHSKKDHKTHGASYTSGASRERPAAARAPRAGQDMPAPTTIRPQRQGHQMQPAATAKEVTHMVREMFDPQPHLDPERRANIQSWVNGHAGPNPGMASGQSVRPPQSIRPPQSMAGPHHMSPNPGPPPPMMIPPTQAAPGGQQPGRSHHGRSSRQPAPGEYRQPSANMPPAPAPAPADERRHKRRHHKSGSELGPGPVQDFPLRPPMPQGFPGPGPGPAPAPEMPMSRAMAQGPMTSPPQIAPDGQRHRRRHHKQRGEPEPGEDMEPRAAYPPPGSMPGGLASPMGMTEPPGMPSPQGQPYGQQQHHRRERVPEGGYSHDGQLPTPPLSIRESMSLTDEQGMPVPPDSGLRWERDPSAAKPYMPRHPDRPIPLASLATRDIPVTVTTLLPAPPFPGPGAPGLPRPQLFPMDMPPPSGAGGMAPPPPPPSFPRDIASPPPMRPTQQQRSVAGTPGPQSLAVRSRPGALSRAVPPPDQRAKQQPTPVSMPAFPGTHPGSRVSSAASVRPPPPAPTPPLHPAVLD